MTLVGDGLLQPVYSTAPAACASGEYEGLISSNHKKKLWENFFPGKLEWVPHLTTNNPL